MTLLRISQTTHTQERPGISPAKSQQLCVRPARVPHLIMKRHFFYSAVVYVNSYQNLFERIEVSGAQIQSSQYLPIVHPEAAGKIVQLHLKQQRIGSIQDRTENATANRHVRLAARDIARGNQEISIRSH